MKAAVVSQPGAVPDYTDFADPQAEEGRLLVRPVAVGVHPIVRALAAGAHYGSADGWPMIPGLDCVAETSEGTLVYTGGTQAPYGTMAELASVPAARATPLPAGADPAVVAGALNPGLSTWVPLQHLAGRASDALVLITGATGVAGRMAVQNARAVGASQIIAIGRDADKLTSHTTLGAETTVALVGEREADVAALEQALGGRRPALVLDLAWGWVAETLIDALTGRTLAQASGSTRYVEIGAAAGATAAVPGAAFRSFPLEMIGHGLGSASVAQVGALVPGYLEMLASGTVEVEVERFPIAQVAQAWEPEASGVRNVVTI